MKKIKQLFVIKNSFLNKCSPTVEKMNDHSAKYYANTHFNLINIFVLF